MNLGMLSMQQPTLRPRAAITVPFGRGAGQQKVIRHSFPGKFARRVAGRCVVTPQASASAQVSSTIKMSVQGRHLEVTPALGDYVNARISKAVSNFEGGVKEVNVRLSAAGGDRSSGAPRQRAEITVYTLRNGVVRAEDEEDSLYAAIDLVSDKVKQQLRKMKEKAISRGKWQGSGGPKGAPSIREDQEIVSELAEWEDQDYSFPMDRKIPLPDDVMRTKTFVLHPTSLEHATEQLEQVGHQFYLFKDKESGDIRVLYKRKRGGLGLIIPQMAEK